MFISTFKPPLAGIRHPRRSHTSSLHQRTDQSKMAAAAAAARGINAPIHDQPSASAMSCGDQAPPELIHTSDANDSKSPPRDPTPIPAPAPGSDDVDALALADATANHIVFVIDRSGSMGISDVRPRSAHFSSSRRHNNRLGCVYEAILRFVTTRMRAEQADVVSVVLFDDDAAVAVEGKPISERVADGLLDYGPGGGTSYSRGLQAARAVMQRVSRLAGMQDKHPVVVFLSDGGNNSLGEADPVQIVRDIRDDDSRLVVNTVHFGSDLGTSHDEQLLKDMAEAGDGTAGQGRGADPEPGAGRGRGRGRGWGGLAGAGPLHYTRAPSSRGTYQVSRGGQDELGERFERMASNMSSVAPSFHTVSQGAPVDSTSS